MSNTDLNEPANTELRANSITAKVLPRSTPFPNFFLDVVMPLVSASAWKVLCFVWRKTVGWNKTLDYISLSQIVRGTALCRDSAIRSLAADGPLTGLIRKAARNGLRGTIAYEPVLEYDKKEVTSRLKRLVEKCDQSKRTASSSRISPTALVEQIDTQKTTIQQPFTKETKPSVSKMRKPRLGKQESPCPVFTPCLDFAYESFHQKFKLPPTWGAKDYGQLKSLLRRAVDLTAEEFQRRWMSYLESTEPFIRNRGGSLAYFCANFDQFINGPVQGAGSAKRRSPDPVSSSYEVSEDVYAN